jgi:hypothetical protein
MPSKKYFKCKKVIKPQIASEIFSIKPQKKEKKTDSRVHP